MDVRLLPTARAAWTSALAAPVALVVAASAPGAWIVVPAAAVAILALIVLDALIAGRMSDVALDVASRCEVGEPTTLAVSARFAGQAAGRAPRMALEVDPKLVETGRIDIAMTADADADADADTGPADSFSGEASFVPVRRGQGSITRFWLHREGPLGLGARQVSRALDRTISIRPDLSPVRSRELQHHLRGARFGIVARRIRGEGTQFEALSEYEPGMDRRRIDWKASARHARLYVRENESERNNQIVFAIDCGHAMCEPVDGLTRLDRAVTAALTASYVALKGGDRVALFGFARRPEVATPFITDPRAFHRLQEAAAGLRYRAQEPNFTLALADLTARLQRRSLIILFTDFTDPTGAELMIESVGRLARCHVVLFVTLEDAELQSLVRREPASLDDVAVAVTADTLARQRTIVIERLRHLGVDIIEAPWDRIGYRVIDAYLDVKRKGSIG